MFSFLSISIFLSASVSAFQVTPHDRMRLSLVVFSTSSDSDLYFNTMDNFNAVNVERAKDCAEHFGECSVQEMEDLKESELADENNRVSSA
jgi:hypothetical protein